MPFKQSLRRNHDMNTKTDCPCGSGKDFDTCCGPLINGTIKAPTPEALMRSRYTAFAKLEMPYLEQTLHPGTRHDYDEAGATRWAKESEWLELDIVNVSDDPENANRSSVEFKAQYRMNGAIQVHHELAEFRKSNGTWYFFDGKMVSAGQFKRETPKVGRNDPCPCGSGKKYKKCCG
jgi:SEC-C motif-containing protein